MGLVEAAGLFFGETLSQRALRERSVGEASRKQKGRLYRRPFFFSDLYLAEWVQVFPTARILKFSPRWA
jgi:hypothetical protein